MRSELYGYEQNLSTAPNVEREYIQLNRQYETMQVQYNDLQQKIKSASLTESLESYDGFVFDNVETRPLSETDWLTRDEGLEVVLTDRRGRRAKFLVTVQYISRDSSDEFDEDEDADEWERETA